MKEKNGKKKKNGEKNMTIRKKLLVSHLCMILIPLLLAVASGVGLFHFYGSRCWDSVEEMPGDMDCSDTVEWLIYECVDQYCYGGWEDEEESGELSSYQSGDTEIWSWLGEQLEDLGYQAEVVIDGSTVLENLTESEQESVQQYFGDDNTRIKNRTVSKGRVTLIRQTFEETEKTFRITAVSRTAWRTVLYLLLYLLFVVLAIVATNVLLLNWLGKSIMTPLEGLKAGTRRIAGGDLDSGDTYIGKNGYYFEKVTDADINNQVFQGGNHGLVEITGTGEGTLLLLKDSFANSFVPWLTGDYEKIIMVDLRYYSGVVNTLIETEQPTQILVLYELNNFAGESSVAKLALS